jgi:lipid II:glycine glycyltransferase (peptidoglycan interpeptide bridge formation enzyme)
MRIINLTDNLPADEAGNRLNEFIIRVGGSFLQSWEWGEFQKKIREKIWRLGVLDDNGSLVAAATIIKKRLPFGKSYFYCPRGPVVNDQLSIIPPASQAKALRAGNYQLVFDFLFSEIKKIAESENVIFLRFEPSAIIHNLSFIIQKTIDTQPSKTLILDLSKSENELLKEMHPKTRYNIKLAGKKGVKIIEAGRDRFEDFWNILDQTAGRDKFRPHGRGYYGAMLGVDKNFINPLNPPFEGGQKNNTPLAKGGAGGFIKLFFAEYKNKLIAAGIFSFFGDTATYMHGGSINEFREAMAPYLLQWEVIKKAKAEGYKSYDFYGIDEEKWPGVTRFKKGFSGLEKNYSGTFDLVIDKGWYNIYRMVRSARRRI